MDTNPVVSFELYVDDLERARAFYETVLGITLRPVTTPPGAATATEMQMLAFPAEVTRTGTGGVLVKMNGMSPGIGGTLIYFATDDCEVQQERAKKAGGQKRIDKFAMGEFGFCSLVIDTEGNVVGFNSKV